jgi:uncharacterized protein YjfI (DUF2170 family)
LNKEEQVVEAEFTEVEEGKPQEGKEIHCGISVIMTEDGDVSVHVHGTNQNLIIIEGLLKYAERYVDNTWAARMNVQEESKQGE